MDEYPIKLEEMIACTFNFENLIKIIQYLHKKNSDLASIVKNITKKLPQIDKLHEEVDSINRKNASFTKQFSEVEDSLMNHSTKLMDTESKLLTLCLSIDESKHKITELEDKHKLHDTNLNNLNRVVEDNTKISKNHEEKMITIQHNVTSCNSKLDQGLIEISFITSSNSKMKENMTELSLEVFEFKDDLEKKNIEIEKTMNTLIASVAEISNSQATKRDSISGGGVSVAEQNVSKAMMEEIEKLKTKIEELIKSSHETDKLIKITQNVNDDEIAKLTARLNQIMPVRSTSKPTTNASKTTIEDKAIFTKPFNEMRQTESNDLHKIIESIKGTNQALTQKANREELDNFNHFVVSKLDIMHEKINENYKNLEGRLRAIHSIQSNSSSMPSFDLDLISQTIEKQIIEQIEAIILNSIDKFQNEGDLTKNPQIAGLVSTLNKHTGELDQAYKSIVDIRSILVSNEILEEVDDIKSRLELNEEDIRRLLFTTKELKRNFDGDDEPISKSSQGIPQSNQKENKGNLRNQINSLSLSHKELQDKASVLEKRHNEMTTEVKDSIKGSLKHETEKVIEQFQKNLNSFTSKFEHQLKNKIDQIGLTSFEYKLNNKFTNEIKEKLDKNDLKKNNFSINRKLDLLENKISKTLVDTIIDLQMDEAPLIVKKNNKNIEKCVSCNQVLAIQAPSSIPYAISNEQMGHLSNSASLNKMRVSKYNIKEKEKLPELNQNNVNNNYNDKR